MISSFGMCFAASIFDSEAKESDLYAALSFISSLAAIFCFSVSIVLIRSGVEI